MLKRKSAVEGYTKKGRGFGLKLREVLRIEREGFRRDW